MRIRIAHGHLHRFVVLIQRGTPHFDDSLVRTRLRGAYLEHFAFDVKLIDRSNWSWPAEFVKRGADDAPSGFEITFDHKPHGDCGGVPTCSETSKYRVGCGSFVEMKRLRIEFGGNALQAVGIDAHAPQCKRLFRLKVDVTGV